MGRSTAGREMVVTFGMIADARTVRITKIELKGRNERLKEKVGIHQWENLEVLRISLCSFTLVSRRETYQAFVSIWPCCLERAGSFHIVAV
jgi:hypothetical protein